MNPDASACNDTIFYNNNNNNLLRSHLSSDAAACVALLDLKRTPPPPTVTHPPPLTTTTTELEILRPLSTPTRQFYNAKTGLVHGKIVVVGPNNTKQPKNCPFLRNSSSSLSSLRFEFWLEQSNTTNNNTEDGGAVPAAGAAVTNLPSHHQQQQQQPLLVAFHPRSPSSSSSSSSSETTLNQNKTNNNKKKKKLRAPQPRAHWMLEKRHFVIAEPSNSHRGQVVLGEVAVSPHYRNNKNPSVIAFTVTCLDQVDCQLFYKVHTIAKVMALDTAPPPCRQVEFIRFTENAKAGAANAHAAVGGGGGGELLHYDGLLKQYRTLLQQHHHQQEHSPTHHRQQQRGTGKSPEDDKDKTMSSPGRSLIVSPHSEYINVFTTLQPTIKVGKTVPSLNFMGRGAMTSNKNMQLINNEGIVCLQVAKYDFYTYHVDFQAPINPFQAFAFGIAQIVL